MTNDRELVTRHPQYARHEFSRAYEALRHHADRGNTMPLRYDRVMQTARRTGASIPYTSEHSVPVRHFADDVGISRGAVIRLRAPHLSHPSRSGAALPDG